jgi:hypothetical protein
LEIETDNDETIAQCLMFSEEAALYISGGVNIP